MGFFSAITGGLSNIFGGGEGDSSGAEHAIDTTIDIGKTWLSYNMAKHQFKDQMALAYAQLGFQQELAKKQMQWRVEDAKAAGLHPLAALGLSPSSFSPVSGGSPTAALDTSSLSDLGQNLDRAIMAGKNAQERQEAINFLKTDAELTLQNKQLNNELVEAELADKRFRLQQQMFPPAPKVNQGEDPQLPSGNSITSGTTPLLGASRLGNSILLHFNPDIADSITEDFVRNQLANTAVLSQTFRLYPEIARKFNKEEQAALLKGDAELKIIGPGQVQFLWRPHMRPKYNPNRREVSGRIRF